MAPPSGAFSCAGGGKEPYPSAAAKSTALARATGSTQTPRPRGCGRQAGTCTGWSLLRNEPSTGCERSGSLWVRRAVGERFGWEILLGEKRPQKTTAGSGRKHKVTRKRHGRTARWDCASNRGPKVPVSIVSVQYQNGICNLERNAEQILNRYSQDTK